MSTECIVCETGTAYESDNDSGLDTSEYEAPIAKALDAISDFNGSLSGLHWIEYECQDCGAVFRLLSASIEATHIIKRGQHQ